MWAVTNAFLCQTGCWSWPWAKQDAIWGRRADSCQLKQLHIIWGGHLVQIPMIWCTSGDVTPIEKWRHLVFMPTRLPIAHSTVIMLQCKLTLSLRPLLQQPVIVVAVNLSLLLSYWLFCILSLVLFSLHCFDAVDWATVTAHPDKSSTQIAKFRFVRVQNEQHKNSF